MQNETELAGRKERERNLRRNEIIDAACEVFMRRGFNDATLGEIAEKAEFGKGTLYNYFENKEELFDAVVSSIFEKIFRIASDTCNIPGESLVDSYRNFTTAFLDHLSTHAPLVIFILREIHRNDGQPCLFGRFSDLIRVLEQPLIRARDRGELSLENTRELAHLYLLLVLALSLKIFEPSIFHGQDLTGQAEESLVAARARALSTIEHLFFHGVLARS